MTLSHEELRSLLAASALNALEPQESEELERHLQLCSHCRAEMAELGSAATLLAGPSGAQAPEGLWEEIVATIGTPPSREMPVSLRKAVRRRSRWFQGWAVTAAAALAAIVVLSVSVANLQGDVNHLHDQAASGNVSSALNAAMRSDHTLVRLRDPSGAELAQAVLVPGARTSFLVPESMAPLGNGRTYQLWAESRGEAVSLGVLGASPSVSEFVVQPGMTSLMITAEPSGGVAAPTPPVLASAPIDL
jgi:anti-sigma factor RsiW